MAIFDINEIDGEVFDHIAGSLQGMTSIGIVMCSAFILLVHMLISLIGAIIIGVIGAILNWQLDNNGYWLLFFCWITGLLARQVYMQSETAKEWTEKIGTVAMIGLLLLSFCVLIYFGLIPLGQGIIHKFF